MSSYIHLENFVTLAPEFSAGSARVVRGVTIFYNSRKKQTIFGAEVEVTVPMGPGKETKTTAPLVIDVKEARRLIRTGGVYLVQNL